MEVERDFPTDAVPPSSRSTLLRPPHHFDSTLPSIAALSLLLTHTFTLTLTSHLSLLMKVKLKVWRQKDANSAGGFREYETPDLNSNMSFLEMLDVVNDELTIKGEEPIAFDHDCREGICGTCSLVINGKPHGPHRGVATCQTYMRNFNDGDRSPSSPSARRPSRSSRT